MSSPSDCAPAGKMHVGEVDIDAALVRRLLVQQFPQWAGLPIEPVDSAGTDNAIFRLGDELAVRLPRIEWAIGQVEREQQWLPALAPLLPVAVPVPLAKGQPAEGYPWHWAIYRWLAGENPPVDGFNDSGSLARELAQFVTALRGIDLADGPLAGRGTPLVQRDAPTRTAIAALQGVIDTGAARGHGSGLCTRPRGPARRSGFTEIWDRGTSCWSTAASVRSSTSRGWASATRPAT